MRRPRQTLAAALLLPLLAGCGGAPQASAPPTPSATTPAVTKTPSAPPFPSSARQAGPAGASAFIGHWVATLNFAGATGNTNQLKRLSTSDCVRCRALIQGINDIYNQGGRIDGGGWTVTATRPYGIRDERFFIDAIIKSAPQSVVNRDGQKEDFDGIDSRLRAFVLKRDGDSWRVAELDPSA